MYPLSEHFENTDGQNTISRIHDKMIDCESVGEALDSLLASCYANTMGDNQVQDLAYLVSDLEYCISELSTVKKNIQNLLK